MAQKAIVPLWLLPQLADTRLALTHNLQAPAWRLHVVLCLHQQGVGIRAWHGHVDEAVLASHPIFDQLRTAEFWVHSRALWTCERAGESKAFA